MGGLEVPHQAAILQEVIPPGTREIPVVIPVQVQVYHGAEVLVLQVGMDPIALPGLKGNRKDLVRQYELLCKLTSGGWWSSIWGYSPWLSDLLSDSSSSSSSSSTRKSQPSIL